MKFQRDETAVCQAAWRGSGALQLRAKLFGASTLMAAQERLRLSGFSQQARASLPTVTLSVHLEGSFLPRLKLELPYLPAYQ
jgi:hypothetical protein